MQCKVVECSVCRWLERLVASSCPRDSYSLVNSSTTPLFNLKSMGMVACRISKSAQVCEAKQKLQGWRGQFVILRGKLMMGPLGQPKEVKGTPTTATRWLNTEKEFVLKMLLFLLFSPPYYWCLMMTIPLVIWSIKISCSDAENCTAESDDAWNGVWEEGIE